MGTRIRNMSERKGEKSRVFAVSPKRLRFIRNSWNRCRKPKQKFSYRIQGITERLHLGDLWVPRLTPEIRTRTTRLMLKLNGQIRILVSF